ncbi:MAG: hypothetical protein A3C35_07230 [Omnitrophica bacterium RIFCSPHIGHO2_02_FULL_46_11]|nr:MAG: hypothetical protein A3C35_07230 [Omnitrophica bacterium RIFCSPHIGHO2_02_FULL_46_11]
MNKNPSADLISERIIPNETEKGIVSIHMKRYVFAEPFCRGQEVLDVACGMGYGTAHLAAFAKKAVGVDLSQEAIVYAREHYQNTNTAFETMDASRLTFPNNTFDVVCSFETIEHLNDVEGYLCGIERVLKPEGIFLVSTPCVARTTNKPENSFHVQEWSSVDFQALLERYFSTVKLFGQRRKQTSLHRWLQKVDFLNLRRKIYPSKFGKALSTATGTTPFAELELDDIEISENDFHGALCILGVCSIPIRVSGTKL